MQFSDLHDQFWLFSKFGSSGSDGAEITLSQSDKWLRQATVIDGWNITTIDTAVAFRKISRGAIWLDYNAWRLFLFLLKLIKSRQRQSTCGESVNKTCFLFILTFVY